MGEILCSLNSMTDFPPLEHENKGTRLDHWREDSINEALEISTSNSEGDSGSPNNTMFMNISFQEALRREKAPDKKKNNLNMVTLRKIQNKDSIDSRSSNHTPDKNVLEEDSGWWKVSGKKVMQEDLKIKKNIRNTNVKSKDVKMKTNKDIDWYLSVNYPNLGYGYCPRAILIANNQDQHIIQENIEYNSNYNYNRNLGRLEFRDKNERVKRFDIKG